MAFIVRSFRAAWFGVDERTVGRAPLGCERLATGCRNRGANCRAGFIASRRRFALHPPQAQFVAHGRGSSRVLPIGRLSILALADRSLTTGSIAVASAAPVSRALKVAVDVEPFGFDESEPRIQACRRFTVGIEMRERGALGNYLLKQP